MVFCVDNLEEQSWEQLFVTEAATHDDAVRKYASAKGLQGNIKRDRSKSGPILVWQDEPDKTHASKHPKRNVVFAIEPVAIEPIAPCCASA